MNLRRNLAVAGVSLASLLLAACGGGGGADPLAAPSSAASSAASGGSEAVVVGSAAFTESTIVAELYAQAISAKGVEASTKLNIGSREVYLKALEDGSISIVPEYTGNLLLNYDKKAAATTAEEVEQALPEALPADFKLGTPSAAVDQDVYVVTKEYSDANGVKSLADLKKVAGDAVLGGPSELATRAYGPEGLEQVYGAKLKQFKPYDSGAVRARDLNDGKIQIGEFFSTESVIPDNGYVVLEDPQAMILPQNVVPLYRAEVASNTAVTGAVDAVQQALTTEELTALNKKVDVDKSDADDVAKEWLTSKGLV
ncbi:osmoprotectant transport system substrate-binding protein [Friedmanniella luteola]|uniref:Osmoprotectant transport system substrate-binding protein n=1 Tax=Friedmanniella luteola TaxID=546871 RepID=A0A1H1ZV73_9ACTN|nr:ABC transporter substrate-binding protein [Friedmanniella luteola]SDT37675.1 osmoprotectant transport system substrate-binding protein [Friedmanniella luteola]